MQMVPISVRVSFLHLRRAEGHEGSPVLGILSFLCGPNRTITFPFEDEAGEAERRLFKCHEEQREEECLLNQHPSTEPKTHFISISSIF